MILTCPRCATRYTVEASKFPAEGRNVRCAKCGHVWHQAGPEAEAQADLAEPAPMPQPVAPVPVFAAPEPEAPRRSAFVAPTAPEPSSEVDETEPVARPQRARSPILAIVGWAGLVATVLLIGWATVNFRQNITMLWPKAASLYATLGLEVNPRGIAFTDVAYHREVQDGQAVLAVTGRLVNVGNTDMAVPEILVALSDSDKRELYHWSFAASVATLHPGEGVPFLTRLSSPPTGAKHLEVRFAGGE